MITHIYALIDPNSGEPRYVGLTRNPKKRLGRYRSRPHGKHLSNWFAKCQLNGSFPRMAILCSVEEHNADKWERRWIRRMKERGYSLINRTTGGEKAYAVSEETKAKLRYHMIRRWQNREVAMAAFQNPTVIAKRTAAVKGLKKPHGSGKRFHDLNISRTGVPLSKQHIEAVSAALKGRKLSDEHRSVISRNLSNKWKDAEYRGKQLPKLKATQFKQGDTRAASKGGKAAMAVMGRDPKTGRLIGKVAR